MSHQLAITSSHLPRSSVADFILSVMVPCSSVQMRDELEAFTPPTNLRLGLKDPETAVKQLPLAKLPLFLCPRSNKIYCPPVFHLGYAVTLQWAADYAVKNGLIEPYEEDEFSSEDDDDDDDDDWDCDDDNEDDDDDDDWDSDEDDYAEDYEDVEELSGPPVIGKLGLMRGLPALQTPDDLGCCLEDILDHINENSGLVSLRVSQAEVYPLPSYASNPLDCWFIRVGSNYAARGGSLPTPADLLKLHVYLGLKTPPAWYMDVREGYWETQIRYSSR